jgi:hypothetical protein
LALHATHLCADRRCCSGARFLESSRMQDLEARIQVLEDIEAVRQLKARYFHSIDRKLWDQLAACFSDDAVWESGRRNIRVEGADAIVRFIRNIEDGDHIVNTHQGHDPEIVITGAGTATGLWELFHYREDARQGVTQRSAVFYEDDYVKDNGTWKIAHCRIVPIYFNRSPSATAGGSGTGGSHPPESAP